MREMIGFRQRDRRTETDFCPQRLIHCNLQPCGCDLQFGRRFGFIHFRLIGIQTEAFSCIQQKLPHLALVASRGDIVFVISQRILENRQRVDHRFLVPWVCVHKFRDIIGKIPLISHSLSFFGDRQQRQIRISLRSILRPKVLQNPGSCQDHDRKTGCECAPCGLLSFLPFRLVVRCFHISGIDQLHFIQKIIASHIL